MIKVSLLDVIGHGEEKKQLGFLNTINKCHLGELEYKCLLASYNLGFADCYRLFKDAVHSGRITVILNDDDGDPVGTYFPINKRE